MMVNQSMARSSRDHYIASMHVFGHQIVDSETVLYHIRVQGLTKHMVEEDLDGLVEKGIIKSVVYNRRDNQVEKRIHRDAGGLQPCEFVIIKRFSELHSFH